MRKFMPATIGLLIAAMLTACAYEISNYQAVMDCDYKISNYQTTTTDYNGSRDICSNWQGLSMYVARGSVTPIGLRLSMINSNAEISFGHGVMFTIEQYLDGEWAQVPFINDVMWILPLLDVPPLATVDENISWAWMHGELPPGQYRIIRDFSENDWNNPIPMWERSVHIYALFTVEQDWRAAHSQWQAEQDAAAASAFARFAGLDIEILDYSPRGLSFTLTNNNPTYTYIINSVFVGWQDNIPGEGSAGAIEYSIFLGRHWDNHSWPFGYDKRLQPGEYFFLEVDWYNSRGYLTPSMGRLSPNPYLFDLTVDISLDVDEDYIYENFRHVIPGSPTTHHRIRAHFDISP